MTEMNLILTSTQTPDLIPVKAVQATTVLLQSVPTDRDEVLICTIEVQTLMMLRFPHRSGLNMPPTLDLRLSMMRMMKISPLWIGLAGILPNNYAQGEHLGRHNAILDDVRNDTGGNGQYLFSPDANCNAVDFVRSHSYTRCGRGEDALNRTERPRRNIERIDDCPETPGRKEWTQCINNIYFTTFRRSLYTHPHSSPPPTSPHNHNPQLTPPHTNIAKPHRPSPQATLPLSPHPTPHPSKTLPHTTQYIHTLSYPQYLIPSISPPPPLHPSHPHAPRTTRSFREADSGQKPLSEEW